MPKPNKIRNDSNSYFSRNSFLLVMLLMMLKKVAGEDSPPEPVTYFFHTQDDSGGGDYSIEGDSLEWMYGICNVTRPTQTNPKNIGKVVLDICSGSIHAVGNTSLSITPALECLSEASDKECQGQMFAFLVAMGICLGGGCLWYSWGKLPTCSTNRNHVVPNSTRLYSQSANERLLSWALNDDSPSMPRGMSVDVEQRESVAERLSNFGVFNSGAGESKEIVSVSPSEVKSYSPI